MSKFIYSLHLFCLLMLCGVTAVSAGVGGGSLVRAHVIGGVAVDHIATMKMLTNGDIAVCGHTTSGVTQTVPGLVQTAPGGMDAFVAIVSNDLTTIKYWTYYGGPGDDRATALAVLPNGNIAVTGETSSAGLTMTVGCFAQLYGGQVDGFVIKLAPRLDSLIFSSFIPGSKDEHPMAIVVDDEGSMYICGSTNSPSGFLTTNGYDREHNGSLDGFVLKVSPGGGSLVFSTYFGGGGDDVFRALTLMGNKGIALTGYTNNGSFEVFPVPNQWDWPPQENKAYDRTYNGGQTDAILTVLTPDGGPITSGFFGGSGDDYGNTINTDIRNDVFVGGSTTSADLPSLLGAQGALKGGSDGFFSRFDSQCELLLGSTFIGGTGNDIVLQIVGTANNQWMLLGSTTSRDLTGEGAGSTGAVSGINDLFIARMSIPEVSFFTTFGWSGEEIGAGILEDSRRDIYIAGTTNSRNISWSGGNTLNNGPAGTTDGFIAKWAYGTLDLITPRGGERICAGQSFAVTWGTAELTMEEEFELQISSDSVLWTSIGNKLKTRSFQWNVPNTLERGKEYIVRVKSAHGHISTAPGSITLRDPAVIVSSPVAEQACEGADVVLNVTATGEALMYVWKRNGTAIANETGPQLSLQNIATANAGTYEVVVNSACGSVTSTPVLVEVYSDVTISEQPSDKVVYLGQPLTLKVSAKGVGLSYQWSHNGQEISSATGAEYTIPAVTEADSGNYQVAIHGTCGDESSRVAAIKVSKFPVSVQEITTTAFSIAPNPAGDFADITMTKPGVMMIADMSGNIVLSYPGGEDLTYPAKVRLNLEPLPAGLYVVSMGTSAHLLSVVR